MATIYFTLQGKGGVGKSLTSTVLFQYFSSKKFNTLGYDTDTLNATFSSYKDLPINYLNLIEDGQINPRVFDSMIETILESNDDDRIIIDNGSTSFHTMATYLIENEVFDLLKANGHTPVINTIIAGGADTAETLKGYSSLLESTDVSFLIWLNAFTGKLLHNSKSIEDLEIITKNSKRIKGIINLGSYTRATTGKDIEDMLEKRITFDQAIKDFTVMPSSRLNKVKNDLWAQLDNAHI